MATRLVMPPESSSGISFSVPFRPTLSRSLETISRNFVRRFQVMLGQIETDVFSDGQRGQQRAGLKNHRHPVTGCDLRRLNRLALNQDFPLVWRLQADELPEQHRLAAATRSHDDEDFAGVDLKINALEHFMSIVTLAKPSDLKPDALPFSKTAHIVAGHSLCLRSFSSMPPAFPPQLPRQ